MEGREPRVEEEERTRYKETVVWDEGSIARFNEKTESLDQPGYLEDGSIEEWWQWLKKKATEAMVRKRIKIRKRKVGFKDWWDRGCTKQKRKVQRSGILWRKGRLSLEKYMMGKRKFKEFLIEKQKEKREREELELRNLQKEIEVWRYLNRRRGKKRVMENNIGKEAWKNHFKELLEGNEGKEEVRRGREEGKKGEREEELQEKEIWEVLKRMKKNKAVGADGLPMEVWKYAGSDLRKGLAKLMNLVWKEGRMPEDWRKSVIVPIYKRGDPNLPSNYRGISLLCSAYKIYAELIRKRIEEQAERKGCLPDTQFGFRKKKSTMDNIFILSHLVQRGKSTEEMEKNKKVYAFFADLKAAFDNVDRGILWRTLREMDLDEGMIRRLELIYEKTEVMVRTEAGLTESFVTRRGVRQGCVLSPLLFNMYMAGISEALKIRKIGGIEVGCERIWELAYADDFSFVSKE